MPTASATLSRVSPLEPSGNLPECWGLSVPLPCRSFAAVRSIFSNAAPLLTWRSLRGDWCLLGRRSLLLIGCPVPPPEIRHPAGALAILAVLATRGERFAAESARVTGSRCACNGSRRYRRAVSRFRGNG